MSTACRQLQAGDQVDDDADDDHNEEGYNNDHDYDYDHCPLLFKSCTLHICHNHHNRWLCKKFQSSVKFSNGYVTETDLILHKMCGFTKSE